MDTARFVTLNNAAVDASKEGDLTKAFRILSSILSRSAAMSKQEGKAHQHCRDGRDGGLQYVFDDCTKEIMENFSEPKSCECLQRFLNLKFLRMHNPPGTIKSANSMHCTGSVIWVLCYNLSIVYALIGSHRGGGVSNTFLQKYLQIIAPIQRHALTCPSTKFWNMLKLCILNNHVCILRVYSLNAKKELQLMEIMLRKLETQLDAESLKRFCLCLEILDQDSNAAGAA